MKPEDDRGLGSIRKAIMVGLSLCSLLSPVRSDLAVSHGNLNISRGLAPISIPYYQASPCHVFADVPLDRASHMTKIHVHGRGVYRRK